MLWFANTILIKFRRLNANYGQWLKSVLKSCKGFSLRHSDWLKGEGNHFETWSSRTSWSWQAENCMKGEQANRDAFVLTLKWLSYLGCLGLSAGAWTCGHCRTLTDQIAFNSGRFDHVPHTKKQQFKSCIESRVVTATHNCTHPQCAPVSQSKWKSTHWTCLQSHWSQTLDNHRKPPQKRWIVGRQGKDLASTSHQTNCVQKEIFTNV